jgi:hypothetical protein
MSHSSISSENAFFGPETIYTLLTAGLYIPFHLGLTGLDS